MKILLIRISSLGDVLHNMPIVQDLLCQFPEAEIDWVVEEAYVELLKLNPGIRKILPVALRRWRKQMLDLQTWREYSNFKQNLQQEHYDLVLETQGLFKTGWLMHLAKLTPNGKKVGLANATEGSGYEAISRLFHHQSITVARRTHAILRGRQVAAAAAAYTIETKPAFGINVPQLPTESLPHLPDRPYAIFFHGSAGQQKRWPTDCWIELATALEAYQCPILLPWGNTTEKRDAEQLAAKMSKAIVLPQLSMLQAIYVTYHASLVVGVDTGLTHIAAAYLRPTVEIYCASPRWKTEGNWSDRIINLGDDGQVPSVEQVVNAVHALQPDLATTPRSSSGTCEISMIATTTCPEKSSISPI